LRLNTRLALVGGAALGLVPLVLLTAPFWLVWLHRQRRGRAARGHRVLLPFQVATIEHYTIAMIRDDAAPGRAAGVARRIDSYLATVVSRRAWRLRLLVVLLEIAPLLRGRAPFGWMSDAGRRRFVDRHLRVHRGLFGLLAKGKQLVRMAYYSDPVVQMELLQDVATGAAPDAPHKKDEWRARPVA
jgi:hypothetical protein